MSQLYLFLGSLGAVLALVAAARLLRLGGGGIADETEAMAEAEAMLSGFEAARALVGSDGKAALVWGRDGSAALLKLHGNHVAARHLTAPVIERTPEGLAIDSGDRWFGRVVVRGADDPQVTGC